MFNRTQALTNQNGGAARHHLRESLSACASMLLLVVVASITPTLLHAAPEEITAMHGLLLVALAQPGVFATWALMQRRIAIHTSGDHTLATGITSALMVIASLTTLVLVIPFVVEIWLWV